YVVEIENRGKLPARNVQIEFSGDLEAKGVAPIAEIGVGEVVPVRVGVRPKGTGPLPVAVGITYKRLFDENRYEVRDTKEIKVEPASTYLVEDVFLIHSDGRLIAHHSRKFREEIDEMIKKLVFVAKNPTADMGALSESPVTLTAMAIDALGTAQATEANELLAKAQSTLETDIQLAWQFIEQARTQADLVKSQLRERMGDILTAARDTVADMERIRTTVAQAQAVHGDLSDVEALLQKAEDAMRLEDLKGAESLIDRAEVTAKAKVEGLLKDRYPRLFLETTNAGLQANRWNRFEMNITNKGNWPAEHVTPIVSGPVEVLGLRTIEQIEPNQKVSLEYGLKPKEAGTMDFDFEVHYTRPLDDGKHQTTDTAAVRVESETGYLIDDGLLFHSTGALVCHESRTFLPPEEASRAANLEAKVKEFVNRAFPNGGKSIQTATFGGTTVLAARGPQAFLAVTMR